MIRCLMIACLSAVFMLPALAPGSEVSDGLATITPKYPVPETVSTEAQAVLARPINDSSSAPVPQTREQWMVEIGNRTTRVGEMLPQMLQALPVSVEKATMAGVTVRIVTPNELAAAKSDKVLMNLHGGAYIYFGGEVSVVEALGMAAASGYRVVAVDYRMPPDHPFPAGLDDAVAVYRELLKSYRPENIAIFGTSAGGGLTASTILAARDQGLPLPGAAIMNTPWSDLSKTGDSYYTNEGVDPVIPSYDGRISAAARLYAGEEDLKHPLVSPVYADFSSGFPPSLLISGTRDLLLSCTVRLHRKLRAAGVSADLHVFEAMWHGFFRVPEWEQAQREITLFLQRHLG